MFNGVCRTLGLCGVVLLLSASAYAQGNPAAPGQQKRQVNQVPDTGVGEVTTAGPTFERTTNLPVTVHANGMVSAALDESFMEATTVVLSADGSLDYQFYTGLERASLAVLRQSFGGWKPRAAGTPVKAVATLEDKE